MGSTAEVALRSDGKQQVLEKEWLSLASKGQ
jgi:hypothetical protein